MLLVQISSRCGKTLSEECFIFVWCKSFECQLGHHMSPLCALSFAPFDDSPIIQWNESMSRLQDGTDIVCLPYTLSPLRFADMIRESLVQTKTFNDDQSRLFSVRCITYLCLIRFIVCNIASRRSYLSYTVPVIPSTIWRYTLQVRP